MSLECVEKLSMKVIITGIPPRRYRKEGNRRALSKRSTRTSTAAAAQTCLFGDSSSARKELWQLLLRRWELEQA